MKKAKYGTPQEIQKKIDEYFLKYEKPLPLVDANGDIILDKQGKPIFKDELPSSSGLAYHLGFTSRCMLHEYAQRPTFADVMNRARLRLNTYWEPFLNSKNSNGVKYFLGNSFDDWREPEAQQSQNAAPVIAQVIFIDNKGKYAKPSDIPTIEAEIVKPEPLPSNKSIRTTRNKAKAKATKKAK